MIGVTACSEYPRLRRSPFYLSEGAITHAVGIEEQLHHKLGVIRRLAQQLRAVRLHPVALSQARQPQQRQSRQDDPLLVPSGWDGKAYTDRTALPSRTITLLREVFH